MIPTLISAKSIVSSNSTIVAIRDTTADGRAFYTELSYDEEHGDMFSTDRVGMDIIREINAKRIKAESELIVTQAKLSDCDAEVVLADKATKAEKAKFVAMEGRFDKEIIKHENTNVVLDGYKQKALSGKIMTVVGGISIGIGIGGILYAVIVTQTR